MRCPDRVGTDENTLDNKSLYTCTDCGDETVDSIEGRCLECHNKQVRAEYEESLEFRPSDVWFYVINVSAILGGAIIGGFLAYLWVFK